MHCSLPWGLLWVTAMIMDSESRWGSATGLQGCRCLCPATPWQRRPRPLRSSQLLISVRAYQQAACHQLLGALEKMVPIFTQIIWVDRNSIRGREWCHQINTWASQMNVLALALSCYSGGHCSQTQTLNETDIVLPTTANSLFLMSQIEIWCIKEKSMENIH